MRRTTSRLTSRPAARALLGAPAALAALLAAGCGQGTADRSTDPAAGDPAAASDAGAGGAAATPADPDPVMGFETPGAWTSSGGTLSSTDVRTEGAAALAVANPANLTVLASAPVASTAAPLSGLSDPNASFAVDVMLPLELANPHDPGALQLFVSAPSLGIRNAGLGLVRFAPRPGIFQTVKFAIPPAVRTTLASSAFADLTFRLFLHVPGRTSGPYRLDHLRVHSPATAPPGTGASADLVALLSYSPSQSTPGEASFPVGIVQVPASFHVKLGSAGASGAARLELGYGGVPLFTCAFAAAAGGTSYDLASCTGGAQAGDLTGADFARLTILSGDPASGPTKIRAQLALDPVGDVAGPGVIPPMPTFWGECTPNGGPGRSCDPSAMSQIVTAYFDALNATSPRAEERWIHTPVPEFARRNGTGAPHDNLTGPPPPDDPPFDQEGHMNPGSSWDAYWRLAGNLTTDTANDQATAHFEANLSGHAVVWGDDVEIAALQATVDTNKGQPDQNGFNDPSASGSLHMYLFGNEIPGGGSADPSTGFAFDVGTSDTLDLPPIDIWIFSITIGVEASAGVSSTGTLSFDGFDLGVNPNASVGAHLEGDINLGVASGGVSADIQLLSVATPVQAEANWVVSTDPGVCNASLSFDLDGKAKISTLGGDVDLEATFGVCPFCDHESWTIFSWDPIDLGTRQLFQLTATNQAFPLPSSLCTVPLQVAIQGPASATAGVPAFFSATAIRPATAGQPFPSTLAPPDCGILTWSSSDPSDTGLGQSGCNPQLTFGSAGTRTLTVVATDQYGETGSAQAQVTVASLQGLQVYVTAPPTTPTPFVDGGQVLSLAAAAIGGTAPFTFTWTAADGANVIAIPSSTSGNTTAAQWTAPFANGTFTVTVTAEDATHATSSASFPVEVIYIQ